MLKLKDKKLEQLIENYVNAQIGLSWKDSAHPKYHNDIIKYAEEVQIKLTTYLDNKEK